MSLQMFSSFIEKAINLSKCARRNDQKCIISREVFLQYHPACNKTSKKAIKPQDTAEVSTTDFSDGVGQVPGSPDSSDVDNSIKMMKTITGSQKRRSSPRRVPTKAPAGNGFQGPPGLTAPPALEELLYPSGGYQRQKLNSQASVFVPSFAPAAPAVDANREKSQQVRNSIRMLKDALEDWESGFDNPLQQSDLSGLQGALSKLTPQEAAMISGFLESKDMLQPMQASAPYNGMVQASMTGGQFAYGQPASNMDLGWMPQRPPLQSSRFSTPIGAAKQQPKRRKPELRSDAPGESLSTHLRDLALLDSARVIMVRKINHLGDDRISAIKEYFEKFGIVEKVFASPTRGGGNPGRVRPATVGFLVMGSVEEAHAVFAAGSEHVIQGVAILACPFKSHPIDEPAPKVLR